MKKQSNKVKLYLRLENNSKGLFRRRYKSKQRLCHRAQVEVWRKAYLRVGYGKSGAFNDGIYSNYQDLKHAIDVFTEKSLVDYLGGEND